MGIGNVVVVSAPDQPYVIQPSNGTNAVTFAAPQGPPGTSAQTASLQHTYSAAGSFNFVHNLDCLTPVFTVYIDSGNPSYTLSIVDANTVSIDAQGACTLTAVFVKSNAVVVI